jgi:hypothetical protein
MLIKKGGGYDLTQSRTSPPVPKAIQLRSLRERETGLALVARLTAGALGLSTVASDSGHEKSAARTWMWVMCRFSESSSLLSALLSALVRRSRRCFTDFSGKRPGPEKLCSLVWGQRPAEPLKRRRGTHDLWSSTRFKYARALARGMFLMAMAVSLMFLNEVRRSEARALAVLIAAPASGSREYFTIAAHTPAA